ncbi:MAG: hypothetical protein M4D80_04630 [Myxococcota bacterium]|nr:hypothetical protein [Myxococcota bacterium]
MSDRSDEPDEEIRGFTAAGPEEFAMVFDVDGVTYLRLSQEETATAHGSPRMTETDGMTAVVAPVGVNALPAHFQKWAGRSVLVDGDCRARVVGFAEVSRVTGEAGDEWAYDEDGNPPEPTPWTVELVRESNVTLAAKLDGCFGTWARAETESAAAIAATLDEPALESAALADLMAKTDHDETQINWKEMGGEGDWRDHVDVTSVAWQHPQTEEKWVFVQARRSGSCGDASVSLMAAYRVRADGTVHRAADLDFAHGDISQVVDVDGDGQPELVMGGGASSELVDLANGHHDSIYVPSHSHGCGC